MKRRVFFRPEAERDLDEQAEYIASERSIDAALKFYEAAEETLALILAHPRLGVARRFRNPLLVGLRVCVVSGFEKHLIFYRPAKGGIEVIRVLHGARDIDRLLQ